MDSRLIDAIAEYSISADKLCEIVPVLFKYRGTGRSGIGIEAQELQKLEPLLVKKMSNGPYQIDYEMLCVLMLAAVKDLNSKVQKLEKKKKK